MNKIIKRLINQICMLMTLCLNKGQKLMCFLESKRMYTPEKNTRNPQLREEYKRYRSRLKSYGLTATKRDFYVFRKYFLDKGNDPSLIVPAYVPFNLLTPVLNPIPYGKYFEDKNMFDKILPRETMPETLLRRKDRKWYDSDYRSIGWEEALAILHKTGERSKIIVKPATDASSGKGIAIFRFEKKTWSNIQTGENLDMGLIETKWGESDLIFQKVIEQNWFFQNFCDTAVCTMRMVIYNSPVDDKCHLIWCGLRIGAKGSIVDNSHAGGLMFAIDKDGKIADYGADQFGHKFTKFNGIDFSGNTFRVPNYPNIVEFVKKATPYLLPHRFIAFDIAVDQEGNPKIIEFNLRAYGGWACQFAGDPMFGEKTDEILKYITSHRHKGQKVFYSIS